jgi:outer membrane lipoprotein-sorting protein
MSSGCSVKRTIRTAVPAATVQYKTASLDEVLDIIRSYDKIHTLACNSLQLTLTSGRRETGRVEEYRAVPGYILLKRPDSTRLNIQSPITKTTFIDLLSVGDELSVWYPRENKLYLGRNSARELFVEGSPQSEEFRIPIRSAHIFEAILPQSVRTDEPGTWVSMEEQSDARTKYYMITVNREGVHPRIYVVRRIWIERVGLTIARQQVFTDEGQIASDIVYSNEVRVEEFSLPDRIRIDRPRDAYSLDVEFKSWRINPDLPEAAFIMAPHPGAQIIRFKERGRSSAS